MAEITAPTTNIQAPAVSRPQFLKRLISIWRDDMTLSVQISLIVLSLIVLLVVFADVIAPYDAGEMHMLNRLSPPVFTDGGTPDFLLGTDAIGRDILSRTLFGGRVSLMVGTISACISLAVGTVLGLLSGYLRGWVDWIIMYVVDVQLSLPFMLLAVAVALVLGSNLVVLMGIAAFATFPYYTRVVRGAVLSLRHRDYVLAAEAAGASDLHIMVHHLLPGLIAPLLVLTTLNIGRIILLESGLSFLGIGVPPTIPTWGSMIEEGRDYLATAWWLAIIPGVTLMLLTMSIGTIGDWLRDITDVNL